MDLGFELADNEMNGSPEPTLQNRVAALLSKIYDS